MFIKQHFYFTSQRGIPNVKMFLTKRVPDYEHHLKKIYCDDYENEFHSMYQDLKRWRKQYEDKERKKQREEEEKKGRTIQRKDSDDDQDQGSGLNILKMTL